MLLRLTKFETLSACLPRAGPGAGSLRRPKAGAKTAATDPRTPSLLADIKQLSHNGLVQRVEMPTELLERYTSVMRSRTHSNHVMLRQKHPADPALRLRAGREAGIPGLRDGGHLCLHARRIHADAEATARLQAQVQYGAGPGTASWVAKDFYDQSLDEYRVVKPNQFMVNAAEVQLENFLGLSVHRRIADMSREIDTGNKYNLIVVSYVFRTSPTTSSAWRPAQRSGSC
ncbi:Methyltransferase-like protein 17, mitochondrial [Phytophthora pseudosyringae]|uniref:Methyltransferase-like protein 17, mitochondrial n=1 Tax=Phytophthora pseudosyringae TaxID=221518 RepID=A0A8T1WMX6_9STRA|nr:Methyltransferase-like protein 17, mitochondrial [Phytophthora pseudosyringae]